jgi:hypothetical protein
MNFFPFQPIINEPMIEPKYLPSNQDKSTIIPFPILYKRPRDSHTTPLVPPKIKQVYKPKEKVVNQPLMVPFIPPLWEEKKPIFDKPISKPSQIENHARRNQNAKNNRHKCHAIAHQLEEKRKLINQDQILTQKNHEDYPPLPQKKH